MKKQLPMAVILAGGRGSRLSPLTDDCPKPLLPLSGKPILSYLLEDLEKQGCPKAVILVGYLGERFEKTFGDHFGNMRLIYHKEGASGGSAAALKSAEPLLEDRFFLLCADGYGHRDYCALYHAHICKKAAVTILCHPVSDPVEFGLALTDRDGKVRSFLEKPDWSQASTDQANIGIYLMEKELVSLIPEGKADVAGDLFPRILEKGYPFYSLKDSGVWRDIGTPADLLAVNLLESRGKSVIGKNCKIFDSEIDRSLIFDGVTVGKGCRISGAILGENCTVGASCILEEGCLIAPGARLPDRMLLRAGAYYDGSGCTRLPDLKNYLSPEGIRTGGKKLPKRFWMHLGKALASLLPEGTSPAVMYAHGGEPFLVAGELLTGVLYLRDAVDLGEGPVVACGYCAHQKHFPLSVYIYRDRVFGLSALFFDENGLPLGKARQRKLRDAFARKHSDGGKHLEKYFGGALFYEEMLREALRRRGSLPSVSVGIERRSMLGECAARALDACGMRVVTQGKGEYDIAFSLDGKQATLMDDSGKLDYFHLCGILLREELTQGVPIPVLPASAPELFFRMTAEACGTRPEGCPAFPSGEGLDGARAELSKRRYFKDSCFAALSVLGKMLAERKSCAALLEELPPFALSERFFDCAEEEKMSILMGSKLHALDEGMGMEEEKGRLRVIANAGRGLRLMAEAGSDADAVEILERARKKLSDLKKLNKH